MTFGPNLKVNLHIMNNIDFRIIRYQNIRFAYKEFLDERKNKHVEGKGNEFEPKNFSVEEIEAQIGFNIESLIVLFVPYMDAQKLVSGSAANLSDHSISIDYHIIMGKIMYAFKKEKLDEFDAAVYMQCDRGLFNERFFAIQSGLCKRGVNGLAIHPRFGSYGFLGIIVTDKMLEERYDAPLECRGCNRCISACPAGAITADAVDGNKCLSYLTQKKILSPEEMQLLKKSRKIYGCDICQRVCPENNGIIYCEIEDFKHDLMYNIELEDLMPLSNRAFKRKFGNRNFAWRGKSILLRNLELIEDE